MQSTFGKGDFSIFSIDNWTIETKSNTKSAKIYSTAFPRWDNSNLVKIHWWVFKIILFQKQWVILTKEGVAHLIFYSVTRKFGLIKLFKYMIKMMSTYIFITNCSRLCFKQNLNESRFQENCLFETKQV